MFTITSNAGLNTTALTPDRAAAVLCQHLQDLSADGPIRWSIHTPLGTTHGGFVDLNGQPDEGWIAELGQEVTDNLAEELRLSSTQAAG